MIETPQEPITLLKKPSVDILERAKQLIAWKRGKNNAN
jgi:hypothetical protein